MRSIISHFGIKRKYALFVNGLCENRENHQENTTPTIKSTIGAAIRNQKSAIHNAAFNCAITYCCHSRISLLEPALDLLWLIR
jgi:hypothetical protein